MLEREKVGWPLSYAQERQWFLEQLDSGNPVYNRPYVLNFTGTLCIDILKRCLNQILLRHDILRARFPSNNGIPQLVIIPPEDVEIAVIDFSGLAKTERTVAIDRAVLQEAGHSFDLERDMLFRFALLRSSQTEHILVSVFHHIVFDGWSAQVLLRELALLYNAYLLNTEPSMPHLTMHYVQYASSQREISSAALDRHLSYWKNHFQVESPVLELPFDYSRPVLQRHAGSAYSFALSADITTSIKSLCRAEKVTLFMYLLTVFKIVVYRYTAQKDIAVGCLVSGRNSPELEKLIGLFMNTLPIKTRLEDNLSFRQLLQMVREMTLEAFNNQEVPYAKLVAALSPARHLNTNPLFQVMFNMHNMPRTIIDVPGLIIEELEYDYGNSLVDVCFKVSEQNGTIACTLIYDTDLFEAATIERMAGHFQMIVLGSITTPDQEIARLSLLTEQERVSLLGGLDAAAAASCPKKCIHHYFEEQAALGPEKVALLFEGQEMTYGELNRRANQLAHYLREKGVGPAVLVAVCVERTFEMIVSFLAVLKAGGAYLPLDLSYPAERLSFMLEDSKTRYILASQTTATVASGHSAHIVCLEAEAADINAQAENDSLSSSAPDSLAYVMYTSGSTGKPKGVAVMHKGIVRLVKDIDYAQLGPEEVFLQLTTIAFDVSAFEIYGSLLNGGKLVIVENGKPSIAQIGKAIQQYNVTSMCITPEMLHLLLDQCGEELLPLRQVLAAGDVLSVSLAARLTTKLPNCRLINAYGPTENSVYTTAYAVHRVSMTDRSIPIGRPIANDRVYILDKYLELLPVGIVGELYATGDGIAQGYLHNPELTTEKFIPNPFSNKATLLYKTGDLARYQTDGNIEFIGRVDNQVKVRGCRIELGEIETVISRHPNIRHCIVSASTSREGLKSLIAYVVLRTNVRLNQKELRSFVRLELPDYMVPSLFIAISEVPLTPVGKLDRGALPEPHTTTESDWKHVEPRNDTETKLAEMWGKLLNLSKVGVTDNFFDLGGHSLLAMRMFADIQRTFEKKLAVSILFQEDTIEKLAQVIDRTASPATSSLVPIKGDGIKPPLFCIHALDGEVIGYRNLALHLGGNQPVYGLKLESADVGDHISIEGLAEKYIREIYRIQPSGPYFLAGHSLGGIVAYEMAQQLYRKGQDVALLALFDTKNPQYYPVIKPKSRLEKVAKSLKLFGEVPLRYKLDYLVMKIIKEYERVRKRLKNSDNYLRKKLIKAQDSYVPKHYPGRITIFRAIENERYPDLDPKLGWGMITVGGVAVYDVSGNHGSLLNEENAGVLAIQLKQCLDEAQKGSWGSSKDRGGFQ